VTFGASTAVTFGASTAVTFDALTSPFRVIENFTPGFPPSLSGTSGGVGLDHHGVGMGVGVGGAGKKYNTSFGVESSTTPSHSGLNTSTSVLTGGSGSGMQGAYDALHTLNTTNTSSSSSGYGSTPGIGNMDPMCVIV